MMKLYTYWRSTAAYRVRMALQLKGIEHNSVSVHLVKDGGQQHQAEYLAVNPQGLVPALDLGGDVIAQSMAIMEYLEETHPEIPIMPQGAVARAQCRAMAQMVAADIHPLNNLRVLQYLKKQGLDQSQVDAWYAHWIHKSFAAIEQLLQDRSTHFAHADYTCISDICLVAQVYNANRFAVPLDAYPNILAINDQCLALPAIQAAVPENQGDAT